MVSLARHARPSRATVLGEGIAVVNGKFAWVSAAAAILVGATAVGFAEEAADEGQLEEVIVTAQKRTEDVQKTAISIATVSGEEMAAQGKTSLDAALSSVPAVQVQGLAQGAQVFIRGVGSSIDPAFADPAIALMVDGVYDGRTEAVQGGSYDIDRVEVLRGPQGTLYGRNASGGSVNVITRNPDLSAFGAYGRLQVGNYSLRRGEGMLNLPASQTFGVRFAAYREKRNGYIDDGSMDSDSWGARAKLLYKPNERVSVVVKVDVNRVDQLGPNTVPVPGSAGQLTFPPPIFWTNFNPANNPPWNTGDPGPILRFPNGWVTGSSSPWSNDAQHPPGWEKRKSETYSAQIDADLGFGTLTILPGYTRHRNSLASNFLFGILTGPYSVGTGNATYTSAEVRLASAADSRVRWLLGAYYLRSEGGPTFSGQVTNDPISGTNYTTDQVFAPGKTLAAFGQITYPITDSFRLTGGLRYSRDKQGSSFQIINPDINYDSGVIAFEQTQPSTTYKAGFEYDLAARSMLYGHVATGFKQGGLSPSVPPNKFDPEKLTSYEIGAKNRFLDNTLQLNVAAFYYDYNNYQLSSFDVLELGSTGVFTNFPVVHNAKTGKVAGGELELDWLVTPSDNLKAAATVLDAKYGEIVLPNNPFVNQGPYELKDKTMANSPKFTATLSYEHTWNLPAGSLSAGFNARYSGAYYATPELYMPGARQGSYTRSGAQVRYAAPADRWSISLWGNNLEDKAQTTYVFPAYRRFVTAPGTFGLTAEVRI
jgi:iron complex outermembrane receptor protein